VVRLLGKRSRIRKWGMPPVLHGNHRLRRARERWRFRVEGVGCRTGQVPVHPVGGVRYGREREKDLANLSLRSWIAGSIAMPRKDGLREWMMTKQVKQ
jgi:hypothetical protein